MRQPKNKIKCKCKDYVPIRRSAVVAGHHMDASIQKVGDIFVGFYVQNLDNMDPFYLKDQIKWKV